MFDKGTPELFLEAYHRGIFPMAEDKDASTYAFYAPEIRALLPILDLHIPKRLMREIRQGNYQVRIDNDFEGVIDACAALKPERAETWINQPIRDCFIALHHQGHAHSIEIYMDGELCGGLYGLAIGAVFCGESMFSTRTNASKIALVHLAARLYVGGFTMLDSQFANDHLRQFGLYEIDQDEYVAKIRYEMQKPANFRLKGQSESLILHLYEEARKLA